MDATKFTAMQPDEGSTPIGAGVAAMLGAMNPKEVVVEAVNTVTTWTSLAFSQCFSKMRRVQFDEEHQRSLLSCHTTEDESFGAFPDEEAMLELRRRVQKVDLHAQKRPMSFAQELEATYNRHKAMQQPNGAMSRRREKAASADAVLSKERSSSDPELSTLLSSDTQQALNAILGSSSSKMQQQHHQHQHQQSFTSSPEKSEEFRRLSVDELLALRVPSPTSTISLDSPEKTGSDSDDQEPEIVSHEGRVLREWLRAIDASRSSEFLAYARCFEQQGFLTMDDLKQLDESDVEQAMSEVGISKFAHRARIRKAILKLNHQDGNATGSSAVVSAAADLPVQPAIAG